jgi:hypothetical protein
MGAMVAKEDIHVAGMLTRGARFLERALVTITCGPYDDLESRSFTVRASGRNQKSYRRKKNARQGGNPAGREARMTGKPG